MTLFAVQWYCYADQGMAWRQFWHDVAAYLPLDPLQDLRFHDGPTDQIWRQGRYALTWACGGDVALNPGRFVPLVVPRLDADPTLPPGHYRSLILVRRAAAGKAARDLHVGLNAPASVSGHLALAHWWIKQGLDRPASVVRTGGHEASVQALLTAKIDLAAVDTQGWALLRRAYPDLPRVCQIRAQTSLLPAPPLCCPGPATGCFEDPKPWRLGFARADRALKAGVLSDQGLGIRGFDLVSLQTYAALGQRLTQQIDQDCLLAKL